jgi:hypothetical protein
MRGLYGGTVTDGPTKLRGAVPTDLARVDLWRFISFPAPLCKLAPYPTFLILRQPLQDHLIGLQGRRAHDGFDLSAHEMDHQSGAFFILAGDEMEALDHFNLREHGRILSKVEEVHGQILARILANATVRIENSSGDELQKVQAEVEFWMRCTVTIARPP